MKFNQSSFVSHSLSNSLCKYSSTVTPFPFVNSLQDVHPLRGGIVMMMAHGKTVMDGTPVTGPENSLCNLLPIHIRIL
jgi:hypothetical protein